MAEEKAPSPLPATLPAGTKWNLHGKSFAFLTEATLDMSDGTPRGVYRGNNGCSWATLGINHTLIDWSSVAALRTPPSPPSEGPKIGEFCYGTADDGQAYQGWLVGLTSDPRLSVLDFRDRNGGYAIVQTVSLSIDSPWVRRIAKERKDGPCPAASPSPPVDPFALTCDDCGKPIDKPWEACVRTNRNADGFVVRLPGTFHGTCGPTPPVEKVTERVDPYRDSEKGAAGHEIRGRTDHQNRLRAEKPERAPNAHDLKVAAMKAHHSADLDRSSNSRLVALGGRHGKRVGVQSPHWPSQDGSDEP